MSAKLQAATTGCLESGLPDLGVIRIKEDHLGHDASIVRTADDYAGTRQYVMHVFYGFELLEHAGSIVRSACFAIWLNMQAISTNHGSQRLMYCHTLNGSRTQRRFQFPLSDQSRSPPDFQAIVRLHWLEPFHPHLRNPTSHQQ